MDTLLLSFISVMMVLILVVQVFSKLRSQGGKNYLDVPLEHTTQLPVPIAAATCTHDWQVLVQETLDGELESKVVVVMKCPRCGAIDKTIETAQKKVKRDWKLVKEVQTPSAYQQMDLAYHNAPNPDSSPSWMFRQGYLAIYECANTGEIREVRSSNIPEGIGDTE